MKREPIDFAVEQASTIVDQKYPHVKNLDKRHQLILEQLELIRRKHESINT